MGLRGKVLVAGGYRDGFCEKLLEASPKSDKANDSRLQDGRAAGQGQAMSDGGSTSVITYLRRKKQKKPQEWRFAAGEKSERM